MRKLTRVRAGAPRLTLALGMAVFCLGLLVPDARGIDRAGSPAVGNHVPALTFTDLAGELHELDWVSSRTRGTVFFFFELRCAACLKEMAFLDSLYRRAEDFGLKVYAVESSGLVVPEVEEALAKYRRLLPGPVFPVVPDPAYELNARFGVRMLPSTFLLESHGVVLRRLESFETFDAIALSLVIERLLRVKAGMFSFALREIGIRAEEEREYLRLTAVERASRSLMRPAREQLSVGEDAPSFEFTDLDGGTGWWEPSTSGTRLTIVFFWGALCLPCIQEMAYLDMLYRETRELGLVVLAVEAGGLSPERTAAVLERFRRFHPSPVYRIIADADFRINRLFGVGEKLPATFFINGEGVITYVTNEFIQGHEESLARRIELALDLEAGTLRSLEVRAREIPLSVLATGEAPSILAAEEEEKEFRSNLTLGDSYFSNWEFNKALPHYLRCLEIEPDRVSIRERVAQIYQRRGELREALGQWEIVLEQEPDHSEARERVESLREQRIPEDRRGR